MKKIFIFLLSLTCLAAQGQYNNHKSRASQSSNQLNSLSYYGSKKFDVSPETKPDLNLPSFLATSVIANQNGNSAPANSWTNFDMPGQGYWSGTKMTTTSQNGRFQAIQTFDIQGNLRESKATFQFPKRKR
jgi:hypothetical protein